MRSALLATAIALLPATGWAQDGPQWDGFYVGGTIGGAFQDTEASGALLSFNLDRLYAGDEGSLVGGVFVGGMLTHGAFAFGPEVGFQLTNFETTGRSAFASGRFGPFGTPFGPGGTERIVTEFEANAVTEVDWIATARGRFGRRFERLTPYVSAGVAAVRRETTTQVRADTTITRTTTTETTVTSDTATGSEIVTSTTFGPSIGLGVEWDVTPKLTARADAQYHFVGANVTGAGGVEFDYDDVPTLSVGIAYKF